MKEQLKKLSDAGVSIWLDDLSRDRLVSGNLAELVSECSVVGVTTNPTIFANAVSDGAAYEDQVKTLSSQGKTVEEAITALTTGDVRNACDVLAATFAATGGVDGRVSIEVEPGLAMDTDGTVAQAKELWSLVDRSNAYVKIPATEPGLPAITAAIAYGFNVNVTLIFGLERYQAVIDAYFSGLEQAEAAGRDISQIFSVASFFVSRVDTEVDNRLDAIGSEEALACKGKAAIANARLAYEIHTLAVASERFTALRAKGANPQRPLWASTGTKNPDYSDTLYVTELVVADTVNTMPEKTMQAFADHGELKGDTVSGTGDQARAVMATLDKLGVDMDDVVKVLEEEGVDKFAKSWDELTETIEKALEQNTSNVDKPDKGGAES